MAPTGSTAVFSSPVYRGKGQQTVASSPSLVPTRADNDSPNHYISKKEQKRRGRMFVFQQGETLAEAKKASANAGAVLAIARTGSEDARKALKAARERVEMARDLVTQNENALKVNRERGDEEIRQGWANERIARMASKGKTGTADVSLSGMRAWAKRNKRTEAGKVLLGWFRALKKLEESCKRTRDAYDTAVAECVMAAKNVRAAEIYEDEAEEKDKGARATRELAENRLRLAKSALKS